MAVEVLKNSSCSADCHENKSMGEEPASFAAGRRPVFVQTKSGQVLDMELDHRDSANSVKKMLQFAFNIPSDESSLTIGDLALNNDLGAVQKDCPLLLTRNMLHRSSSSRCLSPTGMAVQHGDERSVIEILGRSSSCAGTSKLIKDMMRAIESGVDPIPVNSGLGGAYYFRNCKGESVAIVKPTDEEPFAPNNPKGLLGKALGQPGLKWSVRVGETGYREVAAYLLDYDHFANVPPTVLVNISHSIFNVNDSVNGSKLHNMGTVSKIASLQQFMPHDFDASDHGTSYFPVSAVHRIGILDVRIFNTDRHAGNLLVRKLDGVGRFGQVDLIPIDHGLCLPEGLEDPYFEWIHWPQASIPFSEEEIVYIRNLDPFRDCEMLQAELPMIREASLRMLVLCTIFLKEATAFGLSLAEIGEMMSREYSIHQEEPSELEILCLGAKQTIAEVAVPTDVELTDESFQFNINDENMETGIFSEMLETFPFKMSFHSECKFVNSSGGVSKLQYIREEESAPDDEIACKDDSRFERDLNYVSTSSKLSKSPKKTNLENISGKARKASLDDTSYAPRRSAEEMLPVTTGFVKLDDLSEKEWKLFLSRFQEVLGPTFVHWKSSITGLKQKTRLGASCEF